MTARTILARGSCRLATDSAGGVAIEYAMIAAMVALAIIGALLALGGGLAGLPLPEISNAMADALT